MSDPSAPPPKLAETEDGPSQGLFSFGFKGV
jgi:hypothetical protein